MAGATDVLVDLEAGGADYVYDLLTGFRDPPAGVQMGGGMYYNLAFPGHQLAMPPPLANENFVDYQPDAGAKGSLDQNARDVTAFLAWASDPTLGARKRIGWQVLLYLVMTTVLLYFVKKRIWSPVKH